MITWLFSTKVFFLGGGGGGGLLGTEGVRFYTFPFQNVILFVIHLTYTLLKWNAIIKLSQKMIKNSLFLFKDPTQVFLNHV